MVDYLSVVDFFLSNNNLRFHAAVASPLNKAGAAEEAAGYLHTALASHHHQMSKL